MQQTVLCNAKTKAREENRTLGEVCKPHSPRAEDEKVVEYDQR